MIPTDDATFFKICSGRYEAIFEIVGGAADKMALLAARDLWLSAQRKIFAAAGGSWQGLFAWQSQVDAALATFYFRDISACRTAAEFRALVRRCFVEVFDIDLTEEEQRAMDLVGKYLPHLHDQVGRHIRALLSGEVG